MDDALFGVLNEIWEISTQVVETAFSFAFYQFTVAFIVGHITFSKQPQKLYPNEVDVPPHVLEYFNVLVTLTKRRVSVLDDDFLYASLNLRQSKTKMVN